MTRALGLAALTALGLPLLAADRAIRRWRRAPEPEPEPKHGPLLTCCPECGEPMEGDMPHFHGALAYLPCSDRSVIVEWTGERVRR